MVWNGMEIGMEAQSRANLIYYSMHAFSYHASANTKYYIQIELTPFCHRLKDNDKT